MCRLRQEISIAEAKAMFSECVQRVESADILVLRCHGKAAAALVPQVGEQRKWLWSRGFSGWKRDDSGPRWQEDLAAPGASGTSAPR